LRARKFLKEGILFPYLNTVFSQEVYDASPVYQITGSVAQLLVLKIINHLDGLTLSGDR